MMLKSKLMSLTVMVMLINGCSAYSKDDYGAADATKPESMCVNMEPAQEMKCKEREDALLIGLGADKNCNHPYEYERNRCKSEQAKQQKTLDDSLKKHTDK
ncbi:hypothetical protein [Thalassotalea ganghwensis]